MRALSILVFLLPICGCTGDYSKVPEPTGKWVSANPPGVVAETAPALPTNQRAAVRRAVAR